METIEAPSEATPIHPSDHTALPLRRRWTLRATVIWVLEAWLTHLRTRRPPSARVLLPPPPTWESPRTQGARDAPVGPARSGWQLLGVVLVLVLAGTVAWLAWRRIETLEHEHEETVSMTLAAVQQELVDQRAALATVRAEISQLGSQRTNESPAASVDVPSELNALTQQVDELAMTVGAYGAILGTQQQEMAAHTARLATLDASLHTLATTAQLGPTAAPAKARKRAGKRTPSRLMLETNVEAPRYGRPAITLPANLGAWSLGVRPPER